MDIPIVVAEDEITVAGFTETIQLQLDVGPPGERGSYFFSGTGSPPATPPGTNPVYQGVNEFQTNDFYIEFASVGYAWLWRYQPAPIGWQKVGRLNPPIYMGRHSISFTSGETTAALSVPLMSIIGANSTSLTGSDFIATVTPVVSGGQTTTQFVGITSLTVSGQNLNIHFHMRQFSANAVSTPASATVVINLTIGVSA